MRFPLKLTSKEREIIDKFKQKIEEKFPGEILKVLIFGSKVRGDATRESDIDIIVVISSEDWRKGDKIREIGYELDEEIGYKLSIQVISKCHIDYLKRNNFQFINNVEREGVVI
jgi:predicted nucleotidyltransferase